MALNPLASLFGRLFARSGRKHGNRQTDRDQVQQPPRCAWAPRVKVGMLVALAITFILKTKQCHQHCITTGQLTSNEALYFYLSLSQGFTHFQPTSAAAYPQEQSTSYPIQTLAYPQDVPYSNQGYPMPIQPIPQPDGREGNSSNVGLFLEQ